MTRRGLPRRHPDAVFKTVDGEALIVIPGGEAQHMVLNETGALIWEMLDGSHDLDAICARITEKYEVEAEQARRDLEDVLAALRDHGALAEPEREEPAP